MEEKGVLGDMSYRVPCVSYRQSIQSNIEGVGVVSYLDSQSQRPRYRKISEPASQLYWATHGPSSRIRPLALSEGQE